MFSQASVRSILEGSNYAANSKAGSDGPTGKPVEFFAPFEDERQNDAPKTKTQRAANTEPEQSHHPRIPNFAESNALLDVRNESVSDCRLTARCGRCFLINAAVKRTCC